MIKPHLKTVLDFIVAFQKKNGVSPICEEIAKGIGYPNYRTVARYIQELEKAGHIKRFGKGRAKRIVIDRSTFCDANV